MGLPVLVAVRMAETLAGHSEHTEVTEGILPSLLGNLYETFSQVMNSETETHPESGRRGCTDDMSTVSAVLLKGNVQFQGKGSIN